MDLAKMLRVQKRYDKQINKWNNRKTKIALIVELYEMLNEFPSYFKYWSDQKDNKEKGLEEWSDCLHCAMSLAAHDSTFCKSFIPQYDKCTKEDPTTLILDLTKVILSDYDTEYLIGELIFIGRNLGFNEKQMEKAFYEKLKKNCQRFNVNYEKLFVGEKNVL